MLDWPRQGRAAGGDGGQARDVSILVVLDWPRQARSPCSKIPSLSLFQSLLCWIGRVKVNNEGGYTAALLFQSLLCWIGRVKDPRRLGRRDDHPVSILVVLDWPRQGDRRRVEHRVARGFNPCCVGLAASSARRERVQLGREVSILVVLDWPRQDRRGRRLAHDRRVSILVVLDWPRQASAYTRSATSSRSFNPCCVGLAASRWDLRKKGRGDAGVSILVVLDWPRQGSKTRAATGDYVMFQSLLCWIGRVKRRDLRPMAQAKARFQSLLCWIGRVKSRPSGPVSSSLRVFQSLLCWIGRVKPYYTCALHWGNTKFQSLLCWIGRVKPWGLGRSADAGRRFNPCCVGLAASRCGGISRRSGPSPRFNPCCVGLAASRADADLRPQREHVVSILVVLDWPRQEPRIEIEVHRAPVSILVVLDWPRQVLGRPKHGVRRGHEVSILVVLDWPRQGSAPSSRR